MWHVRDKQMSWIVSRDLWSSPVPLIQQKASTFPETQRETIVSSNLLSSQGSLIQQEGYTFQRHNKNFTLLYPSQACLKGSYFLYKECVVISRSIASPKMLWCPCHGRPVPQPLKVHGSGNSFRHQMARHSSWEDFNQTNLDDLSVGIFAHFEISRFPLSIFSIFMVWFCVGGGAPWTTKDQFWGQPYT